MPDQIDLAQINDVTLLKSLAYDRLALIETNQAELQAINTRIQQIASEPEPTPRKKGSA